MPFDPTTAYLADWAYVDGVEDGDLVKRDSNGEELASYPVKLLREGRTAASVKYLWLAEHDDDPPPPAPAERDAITLDAADYDDLGPELVILSVVRHPLGPYEVSCVEPPRNA